MTISVGDGNTRTADVVGWRWRDTGLELSAVEAKAGVSYDHAATAIGQATAYQAGIPHVYAAAEGELATYGHFSRVLEELGLGYIRAFREPDRQGVVEAEPQVSPFLRPEIHAENVARARLLHLFEKALEGDEVRVGRDSRGPLWLVSPPGTSTWQICAQVVPRESHTWLSLLAEGSAIGRAFAANADADCVVRALDGIGSNVTLTVRKRRYTGFAGTYEDPLSWTNAESATRLSKVLIKARKLGREQNCAPQFQFTHEWWPHLETVNLDEASARRELFDFVARLKVARGVLQNELGRRLSPRTGSSSRVRSAPATGWASFDLAKELILGLLDGGDWVSSNEIHERLRDRVNEPMFGRVKTELNIPHRRTRGPGGKMRVEWRLPNETRP